MTKIVLMLNNPHRLWIKDPLVAFSPTGTDVSGGLVVEGEIIKELLALKQKPSSPVDTIFNAKNHVLLPGLVNTHHHFYQTLTRVMPSALNKKLFDWLKYLYPIWARLDPVMLRSATEVALAELLLSGCTTTADHHYVFPRGMEEAIDIQVEVAKSMGCRVMLTRGSMSLGKEHGGLPPQNTVQSEEIILEDSERLIMRYHERHFGAFIQIALAPCSPFSVSESLMRNTALLAKRHDVRLHTHLAETADEESYCLRKFGLRPLDYLEYVGWLTNRTWIAHGIHFKEQEMLRLGAAGVGVAHCPSSNMILASGICRNLELEAAGVKVGLAVDGSASNDGSNLITEARQALLLQKLKYGADRVTHLDALRWATAGSAAILGRNDIGKLEVGSVADLALFKLDELAFAGSHDPLAALLLCQTHRADRVMVAGEWKVQDEQLIGVDLDRLISNQHKLAKTLARTAS